MRGSPQVLLCAPTGRAAQRLEEATGMKAQTIHRTLQCTRAWQEQLEEHSSKALAAGAASASSAPAHPDSPSAPSAGATAGSDVFLRNRDNPLEASTDVACG